MQACQENISGGNFCFPKNSIYFIFPKYCRHKWEIRGSWENDIMHHFSGLLTPRQATSCPSPQFLVDQIQVQKPILVVVTDQMPVHT